MRHVPLGSLASVAAGQSAPKQDEFATEGIPFVRAGSLEDLLAGKGEDFLERVPEETARKYKLKLYPKGAVLFAKSGMSATKDRIYVLCNHAYVVSHLAILIPKAKVHGDYLRLVLKQFPPSRLIKDPAYPAIGLSEIESYRIPIPEEDEDQIRIATLLNKVEGLIAQRKQHLQQLNDLLKSIFLEMFGDPISNPKKFTSRKLSEFYVNPNEGTKCGPFGSALRKEEFVDSGIPVWNMDNIDPSGRMILPFRMWVTEEKYRQLLSYSVIDGDIIISRAGTVGKMCVARTNGEPAIISTNLIRLRLGNKLRPLHVVSLMTYCKGRVGRLKTGPDGAFTHMNTGILDKLEFPYPPIELQNQFAAVFEKVETLKSRYQESLTELESLYGALSQKAFKGELDLSRVPCPAEQETSGAREQHEDIHAKHVEQNVPDNINATLANLNALNARAEGLKAIADASRLATFDLVQQDALRAVAEKMASLRSPLQELKQIGVITETMERAQAALKPLNLEHIDALTKSVELAHTLAASLPHIDLTWLEHHAEAVRRATEPFEHMRKAMEQIALPTIDLSDSMRLAGEAARRLQSSIPDFNAWQQQSSDLPGTELDDEEGGVKRRFTREDLNAIVSQSTGPLSFESLLNQLNDLETVDLSGYETIKAILFELLAEQRLSQKFDEKTKSLLLVAHNPEAAH
jgi:restriction endonuclease S subunit